MKEFDELSREELDALQTEYNKKYDNAYIFATIFSISLGVIIILVSLANDVFPGFLLGLIPLIVTPIIILTSNSEQLRKYYLEKCANYQELEKQKQLLINNNINTLEQLKFNIDKGFVYEFNETKHFIYVDNKKKLVAIGYDELNPIVFSFNQLIDFKVIEDGKQVIGSNVGNAVLGTLLLGGVGTIIGSQAARTIEKECSKLELQLMIDDINNPLFVFTFINERVSKDSETYDTAVKSLNDFLSLLVYIKNHSNKKQETKKEKTNTNSNAKKKLKELKELLDDGIITKEEFELRKYELMEKFMNE